jgi:aminotransferase
VSARPSQKTVRFTESVIREMTRLANLHGAVNLSQGFPDFAAPAPLKEAAREAIARDVNQYAITWGAKGLRDAIAAKFTRLYGVPVDPETEVTVTCGSTEAMMAALLALLDPGDEVVVFEPFYENYGPDAILSGAVPRFVRLRPPDWSFDPDELRGAFGSRTRAVIVNTPNNPTGKVFSREDEIYEHIVFDGAVHVAMASLPGMRERTITINGMSKTYSVTGWRVGWTIASARLSSAIRKVHDFLTVGAAAPLQEAGALALALPEAYYRELAAGYALRRERLLGMISAAGFRAFAPRGAYYVMTDIAGLGWHDDVAFAQHLVREIGIAVVPGSSFYGDPRDGARQVRFAFCKKDATLDEAERRLAKLRPRA